VEVFGQERCDGTERYKVAEISDLDTLLHDMVCAHDRLSNDTLGISSKRQAHVVDRDADRVMLCMITCKRFRQDFVSSSTSTSFP